MNSDEEIVLETDDVVDEPEDIEENEDIEEPELKEQLDEEENEDNEENEEQYMEDEENNLDFNEPYEVATDVQELNNIETITDPEKKTSKNKMTRYEFVRIIGERVMQLTKGAKPLIKQNKQSLEFSYKEIAIEELKANMIPFKIRRFVKDHYEIWKIEELNKKHLESLFY
uniref:DNA-directed RNA polymerase n=1 Tax=viral metagenome TaxID=1070528 RepID=A0A6C0HWQ0_9ZZZZ